MHVGNLSAEKITALVWWISHVFSGTKVPFFIDLDAKLPNRLSYPHPQYDHFNTLLRTTKTICCIECGMILGNKECVCKWVWSGFNIDTNIDSHNYSSSCNISFNMPTCITSHTLVSVTVHWYHWHQTGVAYITPMLLTEHRCQLL